VCYRDVHVFISRVKDAVTMKGEEIIRINFSLCFRGEALTWYTSELTEYDRSALRGHMDSWYVMLVKRFRENPAVAWAKLLSAKYTRHDLLNGITPSSYLAQI
jgi:hypothetical protein